MCLRRFFKHVTLEKLRDGGMLDTALINFGENGTVFLNFYSMSALGQTSSCLMTTVALMYLKFL